MGKAALALAVVIPLLLGVVAGGIVVSVLRSPPAASTPSTPSGPDYLYLTIAFNPETGLDQYFPANFTVPAHTLVVVTIADYDDASNPVSDATGCVKGTVGNTETITNASHPSGEAVACIPGSEVAHTFSLNTSAYDLNVPVPPSESIAVPVLVTFSAYFNTTGQFVWHCLAPCDGVSMVTLGFMMGTITIEEA